MSEKVFAIGETVRLPEQNATVSGWFGLAKIWEIAGDIVWLLPLGVEYEGRQSLTMATLHDLAEVAAVIRSKTPLKLAPYVGGMSHKDNLRGRVFGKLTVIGIWDNRAKNKFKSAKAPAKWVVKCSCGYYETRTAKALKSGSAQGTGCSICHAAEIWRSKE